MNPARRHLSYWLTALLLLGSPTASQAFHVENALIIAVPTNIGCPPGGGVSTVDVTMTGTFTTVDFAIGTDVELIDSDPLFDDQLVHVKIPAVDVATIAGAAGSRGILQLRYTVECYEDGALCRIRGKNSGVRVIWDPDGPAPPTTYGPYPPTAIGANTDDYNCAELAVEVSEMGTANFGDAMVCCVPPPSPPPTGGPPPSTPGISRGGLILLSGVLLALGAWSAARRRRGEA